MSIHRLKSYCFEVLNSVCFQLLLFFPLAILSGCEDSSVDTINDVIEVDPNLNSQSEYLVVFGDIQEYTVNQNTISYYDASVNWILSQILSGMKIRSVLEVGDVTWENKKRQWSLFHEHSFKLASMIPYFVCTGNHDYDTDKNFQIPDRHSTLINNYAHFSMTDSAIIEYFEENSLENYIAKLCLNDRELYLIALEFGPRKEVLEWVNERLMEHPDNHYILLTHEWLTRYGVRISEGSYAEAQLKGYSSYSTPEEIWQEVVKPNPNVICVLCGHNGFSARLFSMNDAGRQVPQILFNLQYQDNGGNGIVQLWEFPAESDSVRICAYDTINRDWCMPDSTFVSFKYQN